MSMKVTFELSSKDLRHFRRIMREARDVAKEHGEDEVIEAARGLLKQVAESQVPDFVSVRLTQLQTLIDMLIDEEWQIPARERGRVLNALAYFTEPDDLIPDHIPGLGFLDDAIMVELVVRELRHEIEAYQDFCVFREELKQKHKQLADAEVSPEERLAKRRKALHERMRRRNSRRRRKGRGSGASYRVSIF